MAQGHNPNAAMLTNAHFSQVQDAIWDARVQYQNLGIELGILPDDVDAIAENARGNVEKGFKEVLRRCLRDGMSQKKIASALQSRTVGYGHLGRQFLAMNFVAPPKEQHSVENSGKNNSAKKSRISSDYAGIHEGTNQHHKQQEKKMNTSSTTLPVKGESSPEYMAIQSKCGDVIAVLDDPVNKSRTSKKLFEANMIATLSSENTSGESMVSSILQGISGNAMKFYKFLAVLQTLNNHKDTLERIHKAFLNKVKQKIPPDTYKDCSVDTPDPAFLSFSRQRPYPDSVDSRTYTGKFKRHLENNGCNPWMDATDIESGDHLSVVIYKTLDECKAVVPIVTRGYAQSLWCMRELYYAMSRGSVQIHPVVIEDGWEEEEAGEWLNFILKDKKMNIVKDPTNEEKMEEVALKIAKALGNTEPNQPEPPVPDKQNEGDARQFNENMTDDEFIQFLKDKGLADQDCEKFKEHGITAKSFATYFTEKEIKDPVLGFSYGGKIVLERVWREIHDIVQ